MLVMRLFKIYIFSIFSGEFHFAKARFMKYIRWCDLKLLRTDPFLITKRIIPISLIQMSLGLMTPFNNRLSFKTEFNHNSYLGKSIYNAKRWVSFTAM